MSDIKRLDLEAIIAAISPGARVLDLGCGDGELLARLVTEKKVVARGVELSEVAVRACIARGLSVRQGNIEEGLADYPDMAFDYIVLSQTIAYLNRPEPVVREMLRVGKRAVISFDSAGYWRERLRMVTGGGYGTILGSGEPRVRAITLAQFETFTRNVGARVDRSQYVTNHRHVGLLPALLAQTAIYTLTA
jgi:methionine biosynthesis protein MetW